METKEGGELQTIKVKKKKLKYYYNLRKKGEKWIYKIQKLYLFSIIFSFPSNFLPIFFGNQTKQKFFLRLWLVNRISEEKSEETKI